MTERSDIDRWVIGLAHAAGIPDPLGAADRIANRLNLTTIDDDATIRAVLAAIDTDAALPAPHPTDRADTGTEPSRPPLWPPTENAPCITPLLDRLHADQGRAGLANALRAGQAAVQPLPTPAAHNARHTPPTRHDPDMWARVYDALDRYNGDRAVTTHALAFAALDAAHPEGSRNRANDIRQWTEERDHLRGALDTTEALLQDIRRAADTHAAGPWLGTALWERLQAATTPTSVLCDDCAKGTPTTHGETSDGKPICIGCHLTTITPTPRSTT